MIKTIKEGKKPIKTKRVYKTTCWTCKCEFEEEDCVIIREKRIDGYAHIEVKCPCCGETIKGQEDGPAFTYEDRIADEKPYDIMTDENARKMHQDVYYDVHADKYDLSKHISWNSVSRDPRADSQDDADDHE